MPGQGGAQGCIHSHGANVLPRESSMPGPKQACDPHGLVYVEPCEARRLYDASKFSSCPSALGGTGFFSSGAGGGRKSVLPAQKYRRSTGS